MTWQPLQIPHVFFPVFADLLPENEVDTIADRFCEGTTF